MTLMTVFVVVYTIWETLNGISPAWIAVISSVLGGVVLKVLEKWLGKNAERRVDRQDWRSELAELRTRLDTVEAEVDAWKEKYYTAREEIAALRSRLSMLEPRKDPTP